MSKKQEYIPLLPETMDSDSAQFDGRTVTLSADDYYHDSTGIKSPPYQARKPYTDRLFWQTSNKPLPHWIVADIGGTIPVRKIRFYPLDDVVSVLVKDYQIQISSDGKNFTTIYSGTYVPEKTIAKNVWQEESIEFDRAYKARYVRIYITTTYDTRGYKWCGIADFQIYNLPKDWAKKLYLFGGGQVYAMSTNFVKLADNWSALSDAEKIALFKSVTGEATIADLQSLGQPFKILTYYEDNIQLDCSISAIPQDQLVVQKNLINTSGYEAINKVTINTLVSGSSVVRIVATGNSSDYYAYDASSGDWIAVNPTVDNVLADGMTQTQVSSIPSVAWENLIAKTKALGFAIAFSLGDVLEDCAVTDITLNVDKKGPWLSQIKGTVYDYSYTNSETLQVKLYKNGTYKINYNPGAGDK